MEYYEFKSVEIDDTNPENEPGYYDGIQLRGDHEDLIINYYDVDRVIKALRQGKRQIARYYRNKQKKGVANNGTKSPMV